MLDENEMEHIVKLVEQFAIDQVSNDEPDDETESSLTPDDIDDKIISSLDPVIQNIKVTDVQDKDLDEQFYKIKQVFASENEVINHVNNTIQDKDCRSEIAAKLVEIFLSRQKLYIDLILLYRNIMSVFNPDKLEMTNNHYMKQVCSIAVRMYYQQHYQIDAYFETQWIENNS